jgi:putative oxidoreductase
MTLVRLAARPLLASMFVVGGLDSVRNAAKKADAARPITDRVAPLLQKVVPQLPSDATTLVRLNGAVQVAAAVALATGHVPRISATVLAGTLVPTTMAGHRFWEEKDPQKRAVQRIHFFKNASMLGGLMLASVDTEGKPGVVWRARRAASDVRREARQLAKDARHQTRLVKAQLT